jgi:hypothetical protein
LDNLPLFNVREADLFVDEELRIDLIISNGNIDICGIQVKPHTFKFMRQNVISFNQNANKKAGYPVHYLFYDKNENFSNLDEIVKKVKNLLL